MRMNKYKPYIVINNCLALVTVKKTEYSIDAICKIVRSSINDLRTQINFNGKQIHITPSD